MKKNANLKHRKRGAKSSRRRAALKAKQRRVRVRRTGGERTTYR